MCNNNNSWQKSAVLICLWLSFKLTLKLNLFAIPLVLNSEIMPRLFLIENTPQLDQSLQNESLTRKYGNILPLIIIKTIVFNLSACNVDCKQGLQRSEGKGDIWKWLFLHSLHFVPSQDLIGTILIINNLRWKFGLRSTPPPPKS